MTLPDAEELATQLDYTPSWTPPTLRIAATYPVPKVGEVDVPVAGHPDNVEIEINLPAAWQNAAGLSVNFAGQSGDQTAADFIAALVSSLFRHAAVAPEVTVEHAPAMAGTTHLNGSEANR